MKVLFVSSGNSKEGISSLVLDQGSSLNSKGVSIDYFLIKGKGIIGYFNNILKLRNHLLKNKYDIVHAHYGLCGIVVAFARNRETKFVISFMGTDLFGEVATHGKSSLRGKFISKIISIVERKADFVIIKNHSMSAKIKNINKAVIPNGVNIKIFDQLDKLNSMKKVRWDENVLNLLFMADPDKTVKNYIMTYEAVKLLSRSDVRLHTLKNVPHNEVVYYLNASDVCLLSSLHEGSPNVVKEAMACNRRIVATDVGDIRWLFGNIEGCYLTTFDSQDMAGKIENAIQNVQTTNGRERIVELGLDTGTIALRIVEVYHRLLNNN